MSDIRTSELWNGEYRVRWKTSRFFVIHPDDFAQTATMFAASSKRFESADRDVAAEEMSIPYQGLTHIRPFYRIYSDDVDKTEEYIKSNFADVPSPVRTMTRDSVRSTHRTTVMKCTSNRFAKMRWKN